MSCSSDYSLVSIIIPAYNAGTLLRRCLESVRNQSNSGFECVVVDDGSTDGSVVEACRSFGYDKRFVFVSQKNSGVSSARNRGISVVKGDYVCFIDSDDCVDRDYVECLYATLGDTDMSVCGLVQERGEQHIPYAVASEACVRFASEYDSSIAALLQNYLLFGPVCKLYRMDLIRENDIEFPVGVDYGEDLIFNFRYLLYCKSIATTSQTPYHYIIRDGSLSNSEIKDYWEVNLAQWRLIRDFLSEKELLQGKTADVLYGRLAGIVCDSIFRSDVRSLPVLKRYKAIRRILSCIELKSERYTAEVMRTRNSRWIKFCLRHRRALPFLFAL